MKRTVFIVFSALVVSFIRIFCPSISEYMRFCWTLGSHERRVLCFEKGTLFPYCFIFPWKRPFWERLKGWETTSHNVLLGNIMAWSSSSTVAVTSARAFYLALLRINLIGVCWHRCFWSGLCHTSSLTPSSHLLLILQRPRTINLQWLRKNLLTENFSNRPVLPSTRLEHRRILDMYSSF